MTVPDVAACLAAVDILEGSTELVDRLWDNTEYFKREMQGLGFDTGASKTPITPIMLGEAPLAQAVQPSAVRRRRLCHGDRLPDRAAGQGAHPRDDLGRACLRGSRPRLERLREGRQTARRDLEPRPISRGPEPGPGLDGAVSSAPIPDSDGRGASPGSTWGPANALRPPFSPLKAMPAGPPPRSGPADHSLDS